VASIIAINSIPFFSIILLSIIPHFIVSITSPPAIKAPLASKIIAITIAHHRVNALDQTAGHILLATSLAQRFIAI
jgi:hypothetical protein